MESQIVITAIVKNESEKIQDTLRPFLKYGFTKILILDTGSEDDTCNKIRELSSNIIIGHSEFKNFKYSRNMALTMCRDTFTDCKFIYMVDCEWYSSPFETLVKFCFDNSDTEYDCFEINIIIDKKEMNKIKCLFRFDGESEYEGDLHEQATGICGGLVPNFFINVDQTEYGLKKTKQRNIEFDIPYYLDLLSQNKLTDNQMFLFAQTYHNIREYDNAIKYYNELIKRGKFLYMCYYRIGEICFINHNYDIAIAYYSKAIQEDHTRCEPYVKLSQLMYGYDKYTIAEIAYSKSIIPNKSLVEIDCYTYYRYLEMIRACIGIKKYNKGLEVFNQYCKDSKINEFDVNSEMFFYRQLLKRKIVILILSSPGYEDYNNLMREYLSKFDIEFYFYSYSREYKDITIIHNHIYIPGEETFIPGILEKTIKVFRMFSHYDYIIRLNSTTFIDMSKLEIGIENYYDYLEYLKTGISNNRSNFNYYGYLNSISLNENPEYGVTKQFLEKNNGGFPFVSGKCIILSKEAVNIFLQGEIDRTVMDDISIALSMNNHMKVCNNNYKINQLNSFSNKSNDSVMVICTNIETMKECCNLNI